ncbi:MAG: transcriptional regulator [Solirubrobacterales bacterium]|jgi:DNA-binding HxlR family transcriptional regulator|nr:transcriptional regulator [Solirubrobacterales bacterium]
MQRTQFGDMTCSIARTLDVVGEPWSPLILRDVWVGINRFDQMQRDLGVSSKVLAERLRWMVANGVLEKRAYSERPARHEYLLTEKGHELCAVLMAITAWGDRWTAGEAGPPVLLRHRSCGQLTRAEVRCACCGEPLHGADVAVEPGPGLAAGAGES